MTKKTPIIVCAHLLNDYSGSPLIFSTLLKGFREKGYAVELLTSSGRQGFLSDLDIRYRYFYYRFFENKYARLMMFAFSQLVLFVKMLTYWRKNVVIYVNTLLPFGAALAGKLMGKRVVYHIHEASIHPESLKRLLKKIANRTANVSIFVSYTLCDMESLPNVTGKVVYNALSSQFTTAADNATKSEQTVFTVLMLCSLKDYKGVREFVEIARILPQFRFELVINAEKLDIQRYFLETKLPPNLYLFDTQTDVHPFYQRANLVLNLSHPDRWIETFGMTILEAFYYEIPCIVPPIGGPTELVENGKNGYQIAHYDWQKIAETIKNLASNKVHYKELCEAAKASAGRFDSKKMIEQSLEVLIAK